MDLSIIIISFNTGSILDKCLKSLFRELNRTKIKSEIIIVDNHSTDGSVEMLRNIRSEVKKSEDYEFNLMEEKENLGFSKAVNKGLLIARGEVVLLLNSDTIVKDWSIKKLLDFEKEVGPAVIGARQLNPDGTIQPSCFNLPTIKRAILEYWFGKKGNFSKFSPTGNAPVEMEAVSGGTMLISKAVIDKIGLLDEKYFFYFEDLDYCRRAKKSGFKIYYLPSAEIIHEHGASGRNVAAENQQWKRLIPSSKTYHGKMKHYLINFILWTGQKLRKS